MPQVQSNFDDIFKRRTKRKSHVIENGDVQCLYFDENTSSLSSEGVWVSDISNASVECKSTHLSDFIVFVRGSYEPPLSSNYWALSSISLLTLSSLSKNTGLKLSLILILIFLLLQVLSKATDYSLSSLQIMKILKTQQNYITP